MATIPQEIAEKFLDVLAESEHVTPDMIEKIRVVFATNGKPNANELEAIFSAPPKEELK